MKIAESSPNGLRTLWEKEKLLVPSNFSFSHNVLKKRVLQTHKNQGFFGKGLKNKHKIPLINPLPHNANFLRPLERVNNNLTTSWEKEKCW